MTNNSDTLSCLLIRIGQKNWLVPSNSVREIARYEDRDQINQKKNAIIDLKGEPVFIALSKELGQNLNPEQKTKLVIFKNRTANELTFAVPCNENPRLLEIKTNDLDIIKRPSHAHPYALNYTAINHVPAHILDLETLAIDANKARKKMR